MLIYHTNDMHGHSEALAWLNDKAKPQLTQSRALYFDSGDALLGSNTVWRGFEPNLDKMGSVFCTSMAMGNREFNYQRRILDKRAAQRLFPLLCSNLSDTRQDGFLTAEQLVDKLTSVSEVNCERSSWRQTELWQNLSHQRWIPALSLHNDNWSERYSLLVLAAVPVQYPHCAIWEKIFGFRFFEAETILPLLAKRCFQLLNKPLRLIVLSHLGLERDKILASKLPAGCWILGGHSHTVLAEPLKIGNNFIVQTGAWAQHIGKLDYNFENPELSIYQLLDLT